MSDEVEGQIKQKFLQTGTGFSEQVLLELIWLVKLVISQRDDAASASDRLSNKVDSLSARLAQLENKIMGFKEDLDAAVAEIVASGEGEAAGLDRLSTVIGQNTTKLAELTQQIIDLTNQAVSPEVLTKIKQLAEQEKEHLQRLTTATDTLDSATNPQPTPPVDPNAPSARFK